MSSDCLVQSASKRANSIRGLGIDIYTDVHSVETGLFYPGEELESYLDHVLRGQKIGGPIRTRSKLAKQMVAEALGYSRPVSFKRTKPRFPGQDLDVYVQQDNNLQIWNEELSPERRYVLIRPGSDGIVRSVRVVLGQHLVQWDRTGVLTSKYQANGCPGRSGSVLVSPNDTDIFTNFFQPMPLQSGALWDFRSSDPPVPGALMPIDQVFDRLSNLVETRIQATGPGQDRIRGELLQQRVSDELGIGEYANYGQWPDIVNQVLEVKLQTSSTINLGLVLPSDTTSVRSIGSRMRHCDARYLVVYGEIPASREVEIHSLVLATGSDFFKEFVQFGGLIKNKKRQIRLPSDLF